MFRIWTWTTLARSAHRPAQVSRRTSESGARQRWSTHCRCRNGYLRKTGGSFAAWTRRSYPISGLILRLARLLACRGSFVPGRGGGERQLQHPIEHVALLRSEHVFEARRVQDLLALIGRHLAKITDGAFDHGATAGREAVHLLVQLRSFPSLLRVQVLPSLHSRDDAFLLLRGQVVEALQPLA